MYKRQVNFLSEVASEVKYFAVYRDKPQVSESVKVLQQTPQAILNKEAAEEALSLDQADPAKSSAKTPASGEALSAVALQQGQLAVQTAEGAYSAAVSYTHLSVFRSNSVIIICIPFVKNLSLIHI